MRSGTDELDGKVRRIVSLSVRRVLSRPGGNMVVLLRREVQGAPEGPLQIVP